MPARETPLLPRRTRTDAPCRNGPSTNGRRPRGATQPLPTRRRTQLRRRGDAHRGPTGQQRRAHRQSLTSHHLWTADVRAGPNPGWMLTGAHVRRSPKQRCTSSCRAEHSEHQRGPPPQPPPGGVALPTCRTEGPSQKWTLKMRRPAPSICTETTPEWD
jgi:hypothetical protein